MVSTFAQAKCEVQLFTMGKKGQKSFPHLSHSTGSKLDKGLTIRVIPVSSTSSQRSTGTFQAGAEGKLEDVGVARLCYLTRYLSSIDTGNNY